MEVEYAVCKGDQKSTSGMTQFLEHFLISWGKQNFVAPSTAEAEYVAGAT